MQMYTTGVEKYTMLVAVHFYWAGATVLAPKLLLVMGCVKLGN